MKYMHFNSSCSYAALANLMERAGEAELAQALRASQGELLSFLRGSRNGPLADTLSLPALRGAGERYAALIEARI